MALRKSNIAFAAPLAAILFWAAGSMAEASTDTAAKAKAPWLEWHLVSESPHDARRFTQGLDHDGEHWLESSGGFGDSFVVIEDKARKQVLASYRLPGREFAEGAAFFGEGVWLLTWRDGIARFLSRELRVLREVRYRGEGWGLTHDGKRLFMSDGSDRIQLRDPFSFERLGEHRVRDGDRPVQRINEMTHAHGLLWANLFQSDHVVVIDPEDGRVRAWIDFEALHERFDKPANWSRANNVLNGITWDADTDRFWLTGKRWPLLFEIEIDRTPLLSADTADR